MKRWIALLLILSLSLMLICGCKTEDPEDFTAETDDPIGFEKPEDEPEDGPSEEPGNKPSDEPSDEPSDQPSDEPSEEQGKPSDEPSKEPGNNPSDEPSKEPEGGETTPVTKETSGTPITFLCQNLRIPGSQKGVYGEAGGISNSLYNRSRRLRAEIKETDADVVLGCEGKAAWINFFETDEYIKENYGLVYKWSECTSHGVFENDTFNDSATPILYKKARFTLEDSGYFWYSDTPDKPSYPYGDTDTHFRICSWAKLKDKQTGEEFYAYAIHIHDTTHLGGDTGIKSMGQLIATIDKLPKGSYAFLGGDYNIAYRNATYQVSMEWDKMIDLQDMALNMKDDGLTEVGNTGCSLCCTYGTGSTQDHHDVDTLHNARHIDHLMAKPNPHMAVDFWGINWNGYEVPEEHVKFGYVSDHYGLVVKVRIGTKADYSQYQVEH